MSVSKIDKSRKIKKYLYTNRKGKRCSKIKKEKSMMNKKDNIIQKQEKA